MISLCVCVCVSPWFDRRRAVALGQSLSVPPDARNISDCRTVPLAVHAKIDIASTRVTSNCESISIGGGRCSVCQQEH